MKTIYADQLNSTIKDTEAGETIIHRFESAGLGKAPFKFVTVIERVYVSCPGATPQPSGTCAYCGNGIKFCCVIKDATGKTFEVGNECVKKTDDEGLIKIITNKLKIEQARIRRLKAAEKRKKEYEAAMVRVNAAKELLASQTVQAALGAKPHPVEHRAAMGESLLGYVNWLLANADIGGQVRAANYIEKTADQEKQNPNVTL